MLRYSTRGGVIALFGMLALIRVNQSHAGVTIIKGPSEESQGSYREASLFEYYGPQSFSVSGPAIFLSGFQVCHPPAKVFELIVISSMGDAECTLGGAYLTLGKAGAKAFLLLEK